MYVKEWDYIYKYVEAIYIKIAHWADEFSTNTFGEMLAINFFKVYIVKKKNLNK